MFPEKKYVTKNGFELTVGVNHLGHFHLTNLLLDLLAKTDKSRIITLSSVAHMFFGRINFNNYNSEINYNRFESYSVSKLSNIYFSK
jgi:NAD(P)-dependent dehydrogenase (short-subunit alcohol dehydrogenase family)